MFIFKFKHLSVNFSFAWHPLNHQQISDMFLEETKFMETNIIIMTKPILKIKNE